MNIETIALSLSGVLVSSEPWRKAHEIGMQELAEKANMPEISENTHSPNYFEKVDRATEVIYPNLTSEERVKTRRGIYLNRVFNLIKENLDYVNKEVISFLRSIKEKYNLVLITTNTKDVTDKILEMIDAKDLFDYIGTSLPEEKDDKKAVFERVVNDYGKPDKFIGSEKSREVCEELGISFIKFSGDVRELETLK